MANATGPTPLADVSCTTQAQNDEKRLRQDMALLTLRLQPPGYRTEKDIRAISEWLLKDRIIQGVASLHTIYMRKLCQEIQVCPSTTRPPDRPTNRTDNELD